jgi:hypothetical protein
VHRLHRWHRNRRYPFYRGGSSNGAASPVEHKPVIGAGAAKRDNPGHALREGRH